jgi:prevent-host-death family protein
MDGRKTVSLYDAKSQLSALVDEAAEGAVITITKHGRPLARLSGLPEARPSSVLGERRLGALADPRLQIDWDKWWASWKRMDLVQQRAFEKSLEKPFPKKRERSAKAAKRTKKHP